MVCGKRKLVVTSSRRLHRQRKAKAQRPPPRSTFLFPPRPEWRHESFRRPAFQQLTGRKDKREFVPTFFLSFVRSFFPSTAPWWPGLPAVPVYTSESARTRARATSRTPRSRRSDFQRARTHARYVATDTKIWATVSRARTVSRSFADKFLRRNVVCRTRAEDGKCVPTETESEPKRTTSFCFVLFCQRESTGCAGICGYESDLDGSVKRRYQGAC